MRRDVGANRAIPTLDREANRRITEYLMKYYNEERRTEERWEKPSNWYLFFALVVFAVFIALLACLPDTNFSWGAAPEQPPRQ